MCGKKTQQIQIRVTPAQKELIKTLANAEGEEVSAWILNKLIGSKTIVFQKLITDLFKDPNSYNFASINDFLNDLSVLEFEQSLNVEPPDGMDDFTVNYLIGMISHRANQLDTQVPSWTSKYKPLDKPYFGTELKSLRFYLLFNALPAFKIRNIFIDSSVGDRC